MYARFIALCRLSLLTLIMTFGVDTQTRHQHFIRYCWAVDTPFQQNFASKALRKDFCSTSER